MNSILIIGMGKFGHHLCENMCELKNEVMVVDNREEAVEDVLNIVTSAKVGDCTNVEVLKSLGIGNFDCCFVCIGTNFQSSLEITSQIKELGAKRVVSKANRDIHAKFLLRNGADEVIYPDRDSAERLAMKYTDNHVFDYIELDEEASLYEIPPMKDWIGKTIMQVNCRAKYHVNIVAVRRNGKMKITPMADYVFCKEEHLVVVGRNEDVEALLKRFK